MTHPFLHYLDAERERLKTFARQAQSYADEAEIGHRLRGLDRVIEYNIRAWASDLADPRTA